MNRENDPAKALPPTSNGQDRRRGTRYRSSESLMIRCEGGSSFTGVSVEISVHGVSAMADGLLRVGDTVELDPVGGGTVSARVRNKIGQSYGFEFLEISTAQIQHIEEGYKKSYVALAQRRPA
jgi:hypothetical protein